MENPSTNTTLGRNHQRKGAFRKVGENLYRYSTSGTYYAVFRVQGKLIWKSLKTDDRELANRKLKDEKEKKGRIDADAAKMTLSTLLDLYEKRLQQYDAKTIETRAWILKLESVEKLIGFLFQFAEHATGDQFYSPDTPFLGDSH